MNADAFYNYLSAHPFVAPSLVAIAAAVGLGFVIQKATWLTSNLRNSHTALAEWDPDSTAEREHDVCAFARQYLLGLPPIELPGVPGRRLVLSQDIEEILDRYVEYRTSSARFVLGPLATGFALICTFVLIAHVLEKDVYEAVANATSTAGEGSTSLATAVQTLGAKFYISAAGIFASIAFAITIPWLRKRMHQAAHDAARIVGAKFCTPATLSAATQLVLLRDAENAQARAAERATRDAELARIRDERQAAEAAATTARLTEIKQVLEYARGDLENLKSIKVSVSDLSSDVTTKLRNILTEDLGVQMKEILAQMMADAGALTESLQTKILAGFERTIEREVPRIIGSLEAIQKSVEGQAESPIERLLEQLQGVVAGGMRGESAQMTSAIKQFSEVVPALAEQLRATAQSLTTDMRSRTDENVRASEALVSQVAGLLERLESQQTATEALITNIGSAASASAESLVQRVHAESGALFEGLLRTSRNDVDELLAKLREATQTSAGSYAELESSVTATSRAILEARDGLNASANAIKQLSSESLAVIREARQSHEAASRTASEFERSATQLREGVTAMTEAVKGARTHAAEQADLLAEHRRQLGELEALWPTLFETYIANFDAKSQQLLQSWETFFKKTGAFSDKVGGSFAEAVEDLSTAVDKLVNLQGARHP